MTDMDLIKQAEEAGFLAAILPVKEIPVDGSFRKFCEDNLCGKYNANYSCPPGCGTVEEVHERLFAQEKALVLEMIWDVDGFDDKEFIFSSRNKLNRTVLQLMDQLREAGMDGFAWVMAAVLCAIPASRQKVSLVPFRRRRSAVCPHTALMWVSLQRSVNCPLHGPMTRCTCLA